jgi:hypothetical protein
MPADTDALALAPAAHIGAERIDPADHLVPRYPRVCDAGVKAILSVAVAVADAAGLDPDPDRAGARLRNVPLDQLQRAPRCPTSTVRIFAISALPG